MSSNNTHILHLIERLQQGTITAEELATLETWYASFNAAEKYAMHLTDFEKQVQRQKILNRINQQIDMPAIIRPKKSNRSLIMASAAVVAIICGIGIFLFQRKATYPTENVVAKTVEIAAGGDKAILTLANGQKIVLEDRPTGGLALEGSTRIIKLDSGMLAYQSNGSTPSAAARINTISTPIGGQFKIILADGTKVWLNAASTLTFPNVFNKTERMVQTTGETYFEVAPIFINGKKLPFKVHTGNQEIEVLGTHFNVNAYPNEPNFKTTLIEGSVRISNLNTQRNNLLKPGQQAMLSKDELIVKQVDVAQAIAWKNGLFSFNNTDIISLMKQLERWYPIDVVYQGPIKSEKFFGKIERSYTLNEVLKVLELGNVHFRIDEQINKNGRRNLIVMQ